MYNTGKFETVIEYCSKILEKINIDAEAYKLRAMAYRSTGDMDRAVYDYTEAIKSYQYQFGKKDPSLSYDKGLVLMCQKKFDKAFSELNDARRIFRQNGNENFIFLEEIGRANYYMGDYKSAIDNFKQAIQNGSMFAIIDLMSCYLKNNDMPNLKKYSDSLLNNKEAGFMEDSVFLYYAETLNNLSNNITDENTLYKINRALSNYYAPNNQCFQGLYYDLLYARAVILEKTGNDSVAYSDYRNIAAGNNWLKEIKKKTDALKLKLGIDNIPPDIVWRTPNLMNENTAIVKATKRKLSIFAQVKDSSGLQAVNINYNDRLFPVTNIENDGMFETKLELFPGKNKIIIQAIDRYENNISKTFYIDFVEKEQEFKINESDTAMTDDIPEISTATNYFALLIANKDYLDEGFRDLTAPIDDANELKDILVHQYEFGEQNVKVLTNGTRTQIMDTLYKMCRMMTDADNLLIFYAGHGDVKKINNQVEGGFIIPTDSKKGNRASYISSDDMVEPVMSSQARHILFVVDACFGGSLMRSSLDEAPQSIKIQYSNRSRKVLTSGNVEEVPDQGKFIQNLKNFLRSPERQFFSGNDLYTQILNSSNISQTSPQYDRIKNSGDSGGHFIFKKIQ
jgi:tetratricopeptide (TPR) repeat protein